MDSILKNIYEYIVFLWDCLFQVNVSPEFDSVYSQQGLEDHTLRHFF